MGFPIVLGSGRGEVLLDLMGLFRVVRLEAYGERIVAEAIQLRFVGVLLLRREAWLLRTATPLRTTWSDEWVKGLLLMLNGVGDDPFKAEEIAERVFLRRVFGKGLQGLLDLDESLRILEKHAKEAEALCEKNGHFYASSQWQTWLDELRDIEARMQNLRVTLGRFAVRLGDRWLIDGEH